MKNGNEAELELIEIFRIIRKRFYIIFIITIPVLITVMYLENVNIKPMYNVKMGFIVGNTINSSDSYDIQKADDYGRFTETYCALAKTSIVADNALKRLNNSVSADDIQENITAESREATQFMYLSLNWSNANEAKKILNAVSEAFIEEAKNIYPTCNIKIIEKMKEPKVVTSDKNKYIMLGIAGSLFLSIIIIFGMEFLDNTIKTEEDVEECLNAAVLAQIPNDKKNLETLVIGKSKVCDRGIIEAYRGLATNISFMAGYKNIQSFVITSVRQGDGKSTTAAMLASALGNTGKRTVLIDCDMRSPRLYNIFKVQNSPGLTDFLTGNARLKECLHKTEVENLFMLSAGTIPPNPIEILSSAKMEGFVEVLKGSFDCIILDTPPIGIVSDAQIMARYTDGCLMVISSGKAVKQEVIKAKRLLESVSGKILGVVLNKVKKLKASSYYYSAETKKKKKLFGLLRFKYEYK